MRGENPKASLWEGGGPQSGGRSSRARKYLRLCLSGVLFHSCACSLRHGLAPVPPPSRREAAFAEFSAVALWARTITIQCIKDLQILICRGVGVYAVYVRCSLFLVGVGAHDDPLSPTNNGTTRKPIKRTTKGRPYNIDGMFVAQATGRRGRRPLQVNAYKVPHKSQFGALCEQCGRLMCLHTRNITLSSRARQRSRVEWISPSATEREARNVRAGTFTDTK